MLNEGGERNPELMPEQFPVTTGNLSAGQAQLVKFVVCVAMMLLDIGLLLHGGSRRSKRH